MFFRLMLTFDGAQLSAIQRQLNLPEHPRREQVERWLHALIAREVGAELRAMVAQAVATPADVQEVRRLAWVGQCGMVDGAPFRTAAPEQFVGTVALCGLCGNPECRATLALVQDA